MTQTSKVYSYQVPATHYDINLTGELLGPGDYVEEFQVLRNAQEFDTVDIHINGFGGRVDTAIQFLDEIRDCKAQVTTIITSECHSAHSMIFLAANNWRVGPHSLMLVHNYSGGAYGKGVEIIQQVEAVASRAKVLMMDIYKDFLTEGEITNVLDNKDIWLNAEEIINRLGNANRQIEESDPTEES